MCKHPATNSKNIFIKKAARLRNALRLHFVIKLNFSLNLRGVLYFVIKFLSRYALKNLDKIGSKKPLDNQRAFRLHYIEFP